MSRGGATFFAGVAKSVDFGLPHGETECRAPLSATSKNAFSPASVQFKSEISGAFARKRHQRRHGQPFPLIGS